MRIAGIQKNSFVDFPGKVCAVLFTPGCNMNCFYCHNKILLVDKEKEKPIEESDILEMLKKRKDFLDGVVISGGEPTLQEGLEDFIGKIKGLDFEVKLDTNGTNPQMLERLINNGMLDYVAMDLKAPFEKYHKVCQTSVDIESIKKSISLLMEGNVNYEFRTTVAPGLYFEDLHNIVNGIRDARLYVLQAYRSIGSVELSEKAISPESLLVYAQRLKGIVGRIETRGASFCA